MRILLGILTTIAFGLLFITSAFLLGIFVAQFKIV